MDILYCGMCHTDLHKVCNDWDDFKRYPMVRMERIRGIVTGISLMRTSQVMHHCPLSQVPGHEVVGIVQAAGKDGEYFRI